MLLVELDSFSRRCRPTDLKALRIAVDQPIEVLYLNFGQVNREFLEDLEGNDDCE